MDDFIGDALGRIQQTGSDFSETAYGVVSNDISPLLTLLFVAYVIYHGVQLIIGTSQVTVAFIIGRVVRLMVILALVTQWGAFNTIAYDWISNVPENVGRSILDVSNTEVSEPTRGVSEIWHEANRTAGAYTQKAGVQSVLPALIAFLVLGLTGIFVAVTLAVLALAKLMMWVLIATAPIFIACFLFEASRRYGKGWINQVILYALIPIFAYAVLAFLLVVIDPELQRIEEARRTDTLNLGDLSVFIMLCLAGAFVVFNIPMLARGIVGGISAGIETATMSVRHWRTAGARNMTGAVAWREGTIYPYPRISMGMRDTIRNASAQAMQNRITANSLPR